MSAEFSFTTVFSDLVVGDDPQGRIAGPYIRALTGLGGELTVDVSNEADRPLFVFVATGGTEQKVLDVRTLREAFVPDEPVLLVAHPGNNSLPASLEVLARLQQDGARGSIFYLAGPDDTRGRARIADAVRDLAVRRVLRTARVGLIGPASDWLVASMPEPSVVREAWGPQVMPIAVEELEAMIGAVDSEAVAAAVEALSTGIAGQIEPDDADLKSAARVYAALKELAAEHELDALTLRCFDLVLDLKTTGCFALSELTNTGLIAGCESDLVSTVGLMWTHLLLHETPWMANPSQVDEASNTLVLAHCTVPRGLVKNVRLRSHFESGLGVGIQGDLECGPVTLVRIGGKAMEQLWLAEGAITATGDSEHLCRTQAHVSLSYGHVRELLSAPLGNHVVLVTGHHADRLRSWWGNVR